MTFLSNYQFVADYYLVMLKEIFPSKEKACVLDEVMQRKSVELNEMPTMVE